MPIYLQLTTRDNYTSRYRPEMGIQSQNANLSTEKWRQILKQVGASQKISALIFTGGEPLLYPHLLDVLYEAKQTGKPITLFTNGSLLFSYPRRIYAYLTTLSLSFDSLTPAILYALGCHDAWGRTMTAPAIVRIAEEARNANPKLTVALRTVVTKLNADEFLTRRQLLATEVASLGELSYPNLLR